MRHNLTRYLSMRMLEADGLGGGGGDPAPVDTSATATETPMPASILFPDESNSSDPAGESTSETGENTPGSEDGTKTDEDAGDKSDESGDPKAGEWKPYENDPDKTDEENAAAKAEHDKSDPANPLNQVPEDGVYKLTMPEGIEPDQALIDALGPEFKDMGLTNGQAQRLADKFIERQTAAAKQRSEDWAKTVTKWSDDARNDKDMGGDKWNGTVKSASRAINELGTPELRKYLDATGGGNHPELIRIMSKVGDLISEDAPPPGGGDGGSGGPADPAHVLFPNDAPKGS